MNLGNPDCNSLIFSHQHPQPIDSESEQVRALRSTLLEITESNPESYKRALFEFFIQTLKIKIGITYESVPDGYKSTAYLNPLDLNKREPLGVGHGPTRRAADEMAAKNALEILTSASNQDLLRKCVNYSIDKDMEKKSSVLAFKLK